jgi:hypothetical protein
MSTCAADLPASVEINSSFDECSSGSTRDSSLRASVARFGRQRNRSEIQDGQKFVNDAARLATGRADPVDLGLPFEACVEWVEGDGEVRFQDSGTRRSRFRRFSFQRDFPFRD